jgi:ATP-dependent RNA helicase RhlE
MGISPEIINNLQVLGYKDPTPIQEQAIPAILSGNDVIGLAQTGTGKTAAFLLPLIQKLLGRPRKPLKALVLSPTRELAYQIHESFKDLTNNMNMYSFPVHGGVSINPQINKVLKGLHLMVGCPGRVQDHLERGSIKLDDLEFIVLDEADKMLELGMGETVTKILSKCPENTQRMFFSATMKKSLKEMIELELNNPKVIEIKAQVPSETVDHQILKISDELKIQLLLHLIKSNKIKQAIIFTTRKQEVQKLERLLRSKLKVTALQGDMTQHQRKKAYQAFMAKKFDFLIATDIAARGLDIEALPCVINFVIPESADIYTHRIGRTGRSKLKGIAYTLVSSNDPYKATLTEVEKRLNRKITELSFKDFDYKQSIQSNNESKLKRPTQSKKKMNQERSLRQKKASQKKTKK